LVVRRLLAGMIARLVSDELWQAVAPLLPPERTSARFSRFRRLTVRYERRLDIVTGFHLLAASLIRLKFLK